MKVCISCKEEYLSLSSFQKCVLCTDGFETPVIKLVPCSECGEEFDPSSPVKRKLGGLLTQCIDCSEETAVKYLGVQASDGKSSQATILAFESDADREKYREFWNSTSGMSKGKVCQLSSKAATDPGVKFKTVVGHVATNHKGKL